ncbi:MAG: P1 family peptidase [Deinococcota bacterium]|nr:P1 family peptidase [Deinococcota bacterium]
MSLNHTLTAVEGIEVGHWTDGEAQTGCTVILFAGEGCVASADVRGAAPGSRETALLEPEKTVERVQALLLSGGSAFGLGAADGVMRYLEEQGRGFATPFGRVPIVPAAVIFDLGAGRADVRPDGPAGYLAAREASPAPVASGRVGAGTGALCGKYLGHDKAQPGGLGNALLEVAGARVAALAVVNPLGDIVDPETGTVLAGAVLADGSRPPFEMMLASVGGAANTTLIAAITDAPLTKAQCKALAGSAHAGVARVTRPSHTAFDGDTAFMVSTARGPEVPPLALSIAVQEVVAAAILDAVRASNQLG